MPVPQDLYPTHAKGQPETKKGQITAMQVVGYSIVEEPFLDCSESVLCSAALF